MSDHLSGISSLTLKGIGPATKLHLDFANRSNLLTGGNGLGKSFILDCAWWAISSEWAGNPAYPREDAKQNEPKICFELQIEDFLEDVFEISYNWETHKWTHLEENLRFPGLGIYGGVDGSLVSWDSLRRKSSLRFTNHAIWNGLQHNRGEKVSFLSNGLISDWILWQNNPDPEIFNTLKRVLHRLSPPSLEYGDLGYLEPGKPTRIPGDSRWIPTIKHSYGEVPLIHASAGVRRIVALAYFIVWTWEEHKAMAKLRREEPHQNMVILLDEIEAHLHPQWQRTILPALLEIPESLESKLDIQLLVATHSPLVMASIEPLFDANQDRIFHIDLVKQEDGSTQVEVQNPDFVQYGTVDSWLRSDIFELSQARSIEAEKAIEDAKRLQMQETVTTAEVEEVSQRLVRYLAAHDSFWPRWTFFAERHGVEL